MGRWWELGVREVMGARCGRGDGSYVWEGGGS